MNAAGRLHAWWQARDGRERRMLAVMIVMVAAFAYWYGLIVPAQRLREAAHADYRQSVGEAQAVAADLQRIVALRQVAPRVPSAQALPAAVLAAAADAGLAVSRQRSTGGGIEVGIDSAEAVQVLAWLDRLREHHGVAPRTLEIERHDGAVRVKAGFAPSPR